MRPKNPKCTASLSIAVTDLKKKNMDKITNIHEVKNPSRNYTIHKENTSEN